ncbi:MAG: SDR family NAD(P)-dependent oxidoreductase [Anaerolineales bacterium]|nr:SDR family NAD(P)-dependent oxidoreductase [Anaerolineales bacterium]
MAADPVVLITGATGEFGPYVARAFAAAGARLAPTARALDQAEKLLADLGLSAARGLPAVVDVTQAASVKSWVEAVHARWGRVDVLVNIAGGYKPGKPVAELEEADLDFMFNLNARSAFLTCRAVVPLMAAQGGGKIINVGAKAALAAGRKQTAYAISKAAVLRLTEALSAEVREQHINVNAVIPSIIDTPANRANTPNGDYAKWVAPGDLAAVVVFLASEAARAIHGAAIPVYGLVG